MSMNIENDNRCTASEKVDTERPTPISTTNHDEKDHCCCCVPVQRRPRQYIADRVHGTSKYHEDIRPPLFICFVPHPVNYFRYLLEQNVLCECTGRIGCWGHDNPRLRQRIFSIGLFANIIAFALTFFSCFSISTNFNILQAASFSQGTATAPESEFPLTYFDIGLRAVALDSHPTVGTAVFSFREFCSLAESGLDRYMDPRMCDDCYHSSITFVSSCIISLLLVLPSITTDFLRMYPNYDVNCQKFYGFVVSSISMLVSLFTIWIYQRNCFSSFHDGRVPFLTANSTPVSFEIAAAANNEEDIFYADFEWKAGNGVMCLVAATLLKIVDIICNLIVPTPTITRDHREQEDYEIQYGVAVRTPTSTVDSGEQEEAPQQSVVV